MEKIKNAVIMVIIAIFASFYTGYTKDVPKNEDIFVFCYTESFSMWYNHIGRDPSEIESYIRDSRITDKSVLPFNDNYRLYSVEVPYAYDINKRAYLYVIVDVSGEGYRAVKPKYCLIAYPHIDYTWDTELKISGKYDFYFNDSRTDYITRNNHLESKTGLVPGIAEFVLLCYYLYESRYESLSYIIDNDFHILVPDNLPSGLVNHLSDEEERILNETLARSYYKTCTTAESGVSYKDEYIGFCTWSEYGGCLKSFNVLISNDGYFTKFGCEDIAIIGDYRPVDIAIQPLEDFDPNHWGIEDSSDAEFKTEDRH